MKLSYLVCAVAATVDQATKNVSITSILEQLSSPVFPFAIPMTVVAAFEKNKNEPENIVLQLDLRIDGQDPPILTGPVNISFQGQLRTRLIAAISPLVIPRPGLLTAELRLNKKILGSWSIDVLQAAGETLFGTLMTTGAPKKHASKKAKAKKKASKR
jgi:hypothetical protein